MLAPGLVAEVRRLLKENRLSQRTIARATGVSRGTVNAIARGFRPDYRPGPGPGPGEFVAPAGPPRRCPGCGGLVQMPCLVCYIRALGRRQSR